MSTYTELRGLKVKYLAADPDPGTAGDVWYNSTTFELKGFVGRAAWSAGPALGTARGNMATGGTQTATFGAGGGTPRQVRVTFSDPRVYGGRDKSATAENITAKNNKKK